MAWLLPPKTRFVHRCSSRPGLEPRHAPAAVLLPLPIAITAISCRILLTIRHPLPPHARLLSPRFIVARLNKQRQAAVHRSLPLHQLPNSQNVSGNARRREARTRSQTSRQVSTSHQHIHRYPSAGPVVTTPSPRGQDEGRKDCSRFRATRNDRRSGFRRRHVRDIRLLAGLPRHTNRQARHGCVIHGPHRLLGSRPLPLVSGWLASTQQPFLSASTQAIHLHFGRPLLLFSAPLLLILEPACCDSHNVMSWRLMRHS
ncbi:uncharacterized protein B0I36DRAFT_4705 [Microdochium trichocladiopsis]|uniref:Uncharacterized protein n=1 Tax=Microdochium trichocladiopsis TaxID=1682393 RepID=A0A9P8YIN6_9PEZI|nr:uncharacterized protein B0I36DRAFT_4705 [Microdochium trichocladiopsis]KAH7040036.1 hypothetical protein B0I36DRAFT_4705 [Microdochium trichocladiopsis]